MRAAQAADDRPGLRALFDQAVAAWGHELASERWFHLMSESDAGAQTG